MVKFPMQVRCIKDNNLLFGKRNQDTCFFYRVQDDGGLKYSHVSDLNIESFLSFADSKFMDVMNSCIVWIKRKRMVRPCDVVDYLVEHNPLSVDKNSSQIIYRSFMARFIAQTAYCSTENYAKGAISYYLIKLQHGDSYFEYYPYQLKLPHVLLPYCTISAHSTEEFCDAEGLRYVKIKLIVRYKDRTAPTELGNKMIENLASLSPNLDPEYKRRIQISLKLYDRYLEQNNKVRRVVKR